ncbi:MAG: hypothetical protein ACR2OV_17510 [Hyphomicrobiaceae bacterium]
MPTRTIFVAALGILLAASQALAVGCLEPWPKGEVYSEEAEMCVVSEQAWS